MTTNQLDSPWRVTWYMTDRCNLACPYCFVSVVPVNSKTKEFSLDEGKSMIKDLIDSHVYMLSFAGGEPLVCDNFLPLATYARESGMTIQVATNGILLEKLGPQSLIEAGFKCVQISIESPSIADHERLRTKQSYELALKAIRACIQSNLPVIVAIAVTKLNLENLKAIYDFAEKEGVWGVKLEPIMSSFANLSLDKEELQFCINEANALFANSNIHLTIINQYHLLGQSKSCNPDLSYALIFPNGSVSMCENNASLKAGNVLELGFKESLQLAKSRWLLEETCC